MNHTLTAVSRKNELLLNAEQSSSAAAAAESGGGGAGAEGDAMAAEAADVREKCLTRFASSDFIMEPEIFSQLKTYFQVGSIWEGVFDS